MKYSNKIAKLYSKLAIGGTSYAASYKSAYDKIISKKINSVLDFGCGTGRSIHLLKKAGCKNIIGIDHNVNMLNIAKQNHKEISFFNSLDLIIKKNFMFDLIFSAHAFIEIENKSKMSYILNSLGKLLEKGNSLILITGNPMSFGLEYVSFKHQVEKTNLVSGQSVMCKIKLCKNEFYVEDYYWELEDYVTLLYLNQFMINSIDFPLEIGDGWQSETKISPHIVIDAIKL